MEKRNGQFGNAGEIGIGKRREAFQTLLLDKPCMAVKRTDDESVPYRSKFTLEKKVSADLIRVLYRKVIDDCNLLITNNKAQ